jgi:hypothetical protein
VNSSEVKAAIMAAGMHPILMVGQADENDRGPLMEGDLVEFLTAAKVLGAKAIFYYVNVFGESEFKVDVSDESVMSDESDEEDDGDSEFLDLRKVSPSMGEFKVHLSKECAFWVSAEGGAAKLACVIEEGWWTKFQAKRQELLKEWSDRQGDKLAEADEEREAREEKAIERLRGLLDDPSFVAIRSQQGLKAYALKKIPDLEEVDDSTLKAEIQALKGEIDAGGLNRKRH